MPQHKNSCPESLEIYNFARPSLGYHYYTLNLTELCRGVEKKVF